ncbi:MAG: hypothetical protein GX794_01750, partial [Acholeplasmataceae bacterium]|nr:hypothetical protein [Acholeplasmataceae bacterium]
MNPEVDLIGRLDQNYNFSLSSTAFRFYDAIYYSAKENDNTQAVFTGFYYTETKRVRSSINYSYFIPNVTISDFAVTSTDYTITTTLAPRVYVNPNYLDTFHQVGQRSTLVSRELSYSSTTTTRSYSRSNFTLNELYGGVLILRSGSEGSVATNGRSYVGVKQTPYISETASSNSQEYVYHEDFVMRNEDTKLTTGESITSFIYYAIKDLLADRLKASHENGMYVLSTTAGSTFGSVLPRNVNLNNLQKIFDQAPNNLNYDQLLDIYLIADERYEDLLEVYVKDLYQTQLNEKSDLLEDDQLVTMKDSLIGTLYYDGFAENEYDNKTLTFIVNSKLIGTNREFDFSILEALLPSNALIAR